MKSIIILFSILSISCFGQGPEVAIELTEMNALYRGYSSSIEVAVSNSNSSDVTLTCSNCDTLYKVNSNQYIIRPGKEKETIVSVFAQNGDNTELVKTVKYKAINLPDPTIFFGSAKNGCKASKSSRLIQAKYTSEIPIQASFVIIKWSAHINEKSTQGVGGNLSAAEELIDSALPGDVITFMVIARGPDGYC